MNDYKELVEYLREEADAVQAMGNTETACEYRQTVMQNSGFCSYGERKDVIQK